MSGNFFGGWGDTSFTEGFLDGLIEGCQIIGFDWRYLYLNEVAATQAGRPRDELVGRLMTECFPGIDETAMFGMLRRCMKGRIVERMENEFRFPDGTRGWFELRCLPHAQGVCVLSLDISRWRQAEERAKENEARLRESEESFAHLSQAGILGILVTDLEANVVKINDTLLDWVGYSRAEVLEGPVRWGDLTPPEWREVDRRAVEELRTARVAGLREKEYLRKDGTRVPVLVGSAMIEEGARWAISFVLDLTERKKAEAAIARLRDERAAEEVFRELLEAAPDAMVVVGDDERIVLVNAQMERLFGYDRQELLGQPVVMLAPERLRSIPPEHRVSHFRDHPESGPAGPYELWGQRKDGSEFPIEVSLNPLRGRSRTLTSRAIRDVSDRRQAEMRLRESEERFRLLVDNVRDYAIYMLDREGWIVSWNLGAERLKGYGRDEILGQPFSTFYPPEDVRAGKPEAGLASARAEGRFEEEAWRLRKDGTRFLAHVVITAVRDAGGALVGFAKVTRDVTERHLAEVALTLANRELEAFSYSVAHDLRAPLRAMNGFARLLVESYAGVLDAEGKDWLDEIQQNAQKMGELIDALLALARLNRLELRTETVDLAELARGALARLASEGAQPVTELVCEGPLLVEMDPRLALSLIDNLVGNAWKFTRAAAHPRIEVGKTTKGGERVFFVRDNGAGFDMAFAGKLFAPFQRLHDAGEFPGHGVGLATVQRIVHRHAGRIWAEAEVGRGATFYFTVPEP